MAYLTVAVVLLALLGLLNLALVYGVVRRLRDGAADASSGNRPADEKILGPGSAVAPFTALDTDGRPLTLGDLTEGLTVLFLAPWCAACQELLPLVAERAAAYGPERLLTVIEQDPQQEGGGVAEYVERLAPVARVAVAREGDELVEAFRLTGMPVYVQMGADGIIAATGRTLPRRTDPVQAGH
ncbi:TlpA disulfide reductase family protein [Streptomyces triculaminicus]|uniref:TlpA family protein disulfide reductase n=1 Tax=Streptomyces triculaminicus TaxID=2816232 RepID=UPI0033DE0B97